MVTKMGLCDTTVTQGGKYTDSPKNISLDYNDLMCGRGEIGKHKGLKTAYLTGLVTRVHANLFKHISYLVDTISVASLSKGVARCRNRVTTNLTI